MSTLLESVAEDQEEVPLINVNTEMTDEPVIQSAEFPVGESEDDVNDYFQEVISLTVNFNLG